ncbi:hypothetical protein WJX77_003691 [Trebouxia sp. C0004]
MTTSSEQQAGIDDQHGRQQRQPLSVVVSTVVKAWFQDTLKAAKQGEAEQMLVLSSMLEAGYGCNPNASQAKMWADKAQKGLQNRQQVPGGKERY